MTVINFHRNFNQSIYDEVTAVQFMQHKNKHTGWIYDSRAEYGARH